MASWFGGGTFLLFCGCVYCMCVSVRARALASDML